MKKMSVALVALVVMAIGAKAADPVTSVNIVGYMSDQQAKGSFNLMSVDLDILNGTNLISDVLDPESLPTGSKVYIWNPTLQTYGQTESLSSLPPPVHWVPGTNVLERGASYWLSLPSSAAETNDVTLIGEVPQYDTDVVISAGFSYVAYPYPSSVAITNSGIPAKSGDKLFFWNGSGWGSESFSSLPPPAHWTPGTHILEPGKGFLYQSGASTNKMWSPVVPY